MRNESIVDSKISCSVNEYSISILVDFDALKECFSGRLPSWCIRSYAFGIQKEDDVQIFWKNRGNNFKENENL